MRVVIPIGKSRPGTLPYVLRSLAEHAGITEVITVGEAPKGIEPDRHIDSPNANKPHVNIAGHLRRVCEAIEGDWIWTDDDTFTLKPWTPGVYVHKHSVAGMLRVYPNRGTWSQAVRASIKVMTEWGYDPEEVPCGTVHRPWLVSTDRVRLVVDTLDEVGGGSFRALYPAGLSDLIEASNPKILGRKVPHPDSDVISLFDDSWKTNAGRIVRETFTERSRWESGPSEGMALSVNASSAVARRHRRRSHLHR
jgi:hypothetical protein